MRIVHAVAALLLAPLLMGAANSPVDRKATPPDSIVSAANPDAAPIPVDALFYMRSVSGPTWSPDGREVAFTTDITGRSNLWKVAAAGGWPMQLTVSNDRQMGASWSPDGKWIVYQQDHGGNEIWQLFAIPADGGTPVLLAGDADTAVSDPAWSPDGSQLLVMVKSKQASVADIGVLDFKTRKLRILHHETTRDRRWVPVAWAPDGKAVYANRINAAFTASEVWRIGLDGSTRKLAPSKGDALVMATAVSPDGKDLLLSSNAKNGNDNVGLLDVASGKLHWVTDTGWSAKPGGFSPDGRSFTYILNIDGSYQTWLVSRATLQAQELKFPGGMAVPVGSPGAFSPDGKSLLIGFQNAQHPDDLWVYDLATEKPHQLTFSGLAALKPSRIPEAQLVHYRSFDGTMISAYLWMPFNLKRDGSNPAVVLPHGGPTGQTRNTFNALAAALASRGYICISPNVRGSTGYGIAFEKANYKDFGGGDLKDELYATKFLTATGYVDAKRIGIAGGSYGGYMTLIAVSKTPDVWAAGVSQYGILSWLTMLEHSDPLLREYEIGKLGDPVKDRKVYVDASPVSFLANTKAPLLLLQGDNDIRVPREETVQAVKLLKAHGKTVGVHYYPDEGHGFMKRENRIDAMNRTLDWFDKYLKHGSAR